MVAIKIIFLIIGFIVSINISGKNLNVYLESESIISTSTSKLSSKKIINISKYGAIANDDIDDTKAIQNAINAEYGNDLYFNTGVYLISNLELISNTSLIGVESQKSTFKVIGPEGSKFISGKGVHNVILKNISIIYENKIPINLLFLESSMLDTVNNILIEKCFFVNFSSADCLVFSKYFKNVFVSNCTVEATKNPPLRNDYTMISCIKLLGYNEMNNTKSPVVIKNNILKYGNVGFTIVTKGTPPGPIVFKGNNISHQTGSGAIFYHASFCTIQNNTFKHINSIALSNNDGGVVWLDQAGIGKTNFSNNKIDSCSGNAIFLEELHNGIIFGNRISDISKRAINYSIVYEDSSYDSNGGNGILVTGGTVGLDINNNYICNVDANAISINRYLGIHYKYLIDSIIINKNEICRVGENGINIVGRAINVSISNNIFDLPKKDSKSKIAKFARVSQKKSAGKSAVYIQAKNPKHDLKSLIFTNNEIRNSSHNNDTIIGITKTYPGGKLQCSKNKFKQNSKKEINWPGFKNLNY